MIERKNNYRLYVHLTVTSSIALDTYYKTRIFMTLYI
uniref:Uncharacterized protein n=1 Tax=Rhizophora mucronata TaxID=61149 RepID=A0A2P2KEA2_RHIMU